MARSDEALKQRMGNENNLYTTAPYMHYPHGVDNMGNDTTDHIISGLEINKQGYRVVALLSSLRRY
jgi:hypothetical protein